MTHFREGVAVMNIPVSYKIIVVKYRLSANISKRKMGANLVRIRVQRVWTTVDRRRRTTQRCEEKTFVSLLSLDLDQLMVFDCIRI